MQEDRVLGSYCCGSCDLAEAGVGQPVLMRKVCFIRRAVKDLLRACHLKTEISEKAGLLEVCLKNKLESEWSQITGGCHYILEYIRVRLQRALNARKKSSDYILWAVGSHWKIAG